MRSCFFLFFSDILSIVFIGFVSQFLGEIPRVLVFFFTEKQWILCETHRRGWAGTLGPWRFRCFCHRRSLEIHQDIRIWWFFDVGYVACVISSQIFWGRNFLWLNKQPIDQPGDDNSDPVFCIYRPGPGLPVYPKKLHHSNLHSSILLPSWLWGVYTSIYIYKYVYILITQYQSPWRSHVVLNSS